MTSDERLERLGERVDALTESVELLATLHGDLEKETAAKFAELAAKSQQTEALIAQRFSETLGFINRLAHIAEAQRLENLENQ